jgi:hypothetical protein
MSPLASWILIAAITTGVFVLTMGLYLFDLERENKSLKRELDLAQPPF